MNVPPNGPPKAVFLTKKQREELQKKEEEEKARAEKEKEEEIKKAREKYLNYNAEVEKRKQEREKTMKEIDRKKEERRKRSRSRSQEKQRDREREDKDRKGDLDKDRIMISSDRGNVSQRYEQSEKEINTIKSTYLGLKEKKKRMTKPSEKFKNIFNFEWDNSEDTAADINPLYATRQESSILFGRGIRAGMDAVEQEKRADNYERQIKKFEDRQMEVEGGKNDEERDEEERKEGAFNPGSRAIAKRSIYELGDTKHWSEKKAEEMTERDWRIFREDHDIIIKGGRVPKPMKEWDDKLLPDFIMKAIRKLGFTKPTPIQMQGIPIGLARRDMIGLAPTGSGKSAAFMIPLIMFLNSLPPIDEKTLHDGPYAIVLAPTRELVIQLHKDFEKLAQYTKLRASAVVGGRSAEEQAFTIRKGVEVIIATPGRLKDALESRYTVLNQCSYVIIDEADRMVLDLGFEEALKEILDAIPSTNLKSEEESVAEIQEAITKAGEKIYRVTHMFSATMTPQIETIARKYLRCPSYISIGEPGGGKKEIEQRIEMISESEKKSRLQKALSYTEPPVIVFANSKRGVEVLHKYIDKWGWKAVIYHGGKTQQQREAAVDGFKSRKYDVLVATDVAGRGLDVEGVRHVINFDAPKNILEFVHRTGRTGRAGKKGIATTFLTKHDEALFYDLKNFLVQNDQYVPQELLDHPASKIKPGTVDAKPRHKQVVFAQ